MKEKLIYGVGVSSQGKHLKTLNKKKSPAYVAWHNMLRRCYDPKFIYSSAYESAQVDESWHDFQTFADWYCQNIPDIVCKKLVLDKDIKVFGNKVYSPETCLIVPSEVNELFIGCTNFKTDGSLGVTYIASKNMFMSRCRIKAGKELYLGLFASEQEANLKWRETKSRLILEMSELYNGELSEYLKKLARELATL